MSLRHNARPDHDASSTAAGTSLRFRALTVALVLCAFSSFAIGELAAMPNFHGGKAAIPKLNYDSLFTAATPLDQSPEGLALLDACLQAYGGVEKLSGITTGQTDWMMATAIDGGDTVRVTRMWDTEGHYRIERAAAGWSESRWLCGAEAWYQTTDTVIELTGGGRYNAELFSYLVLRMPLATRTVPFSEMRFGTRDAGDSLAYIYCLKQDTLMLVLGIDKASHYIRQVEGAIYQDGQAFIFVNRFDEFSPEGGIMFPHALTNIAMGVIVGQSRLEKALFNEKLPDDICRQKKYRAPGRAH